MVLPTTPVPPVTSVHAVAFNLVCLSGVKMPMLHPPTSLNDVRNLTSLTGHDGLSGADLYNGNLEDGTPIVVKHSLPGQDLFQRLLGHADSLELTLWHEGAFDLLPGAVSSPTIGGWVDRDGTWIVMRDLGARILGLDHPYGVQEIDRLLGALDALHSSGLRPKARTPLDKVLGMFSPRRVAAIAASSDLASKIDRGWSLFRDIASPGLAERVIVLANELDPLLSALAARPAGFCHGDIAGVNMAWDGDGVVLLDWGQAFIGPPALDVARFLPSGLRSSPLNNDDLIGRYRELLGKRFDPDGLELSLLAAFVWYGWQKTLDAKETADPQRKRIETDNLQWWCERLPRALRLID